MFGTIYCIEEERVNKEIESLIRLEQIDIEIARLENSKESYPKKVVELSKELLIKKDAYDTVQQEIDDQTVSLTNAENDLATNKEGLDKSHARLNDVTTNREYDAVLLEINERKDMIDKANKNKVRYRDKIAALTAGNEEKEISSIDQLKDAYDTILNEKQPEIDELNAKIASIDDDVKEVAVTRTAQAAEVPAKYLDRYEIIAHKRKSGRVLSIIGETSRACGYCYQLLTPNTMKRTKLNSGAVLCENCGSLLVWDDTKKSSEENSEKE